MSRYREVAAQRGRIVRALVEHAGTARMEACAEALADAHRFNEQHPELAIPAPFRIVNRHPPECGDCGGEGTRGRFVDGADHEVTCGRCGGSGFTDIWGVGAQARPLG